jgi:hypothetical protein
MRRSKRNQTVESDTKRTRRKLRYNSLSKASHGATSDGEEEVAEFLTPPHSDLSPLNSAIIITTINEQDETPLLYQIPKSVSFEVLSFLDSEDFPYLEIVGHESLEQVREEVAARIRILYRRHHIPISQFAHKKFWENEWWLSNVITGCIHETPERSFDAALRTSVGILSPSACLSPCATLTSASPSGSHINRSASKVLDTFKDDRILKRDLYTADETHLDNINSKFKKCGLTRGEDYAQCPSLLDPPTRNVHSVSSPSYSSSLTPRSTTTSSGSSSSCCEKKVSWHQKMCPHGITNSWLQELHKWDSALHVPRDGSLAEVVEQAHRGAHIILSPGVHGEIKLN